MFEPVDYNVLREGTEIILKKNNKEVLAKFFVDATDNRITVKSIDENTPLEAIGKLTVYLDENFGAKQIFILPKTMRQNFESFGFSSAKSQPEMRIRVTSFESLSGVETGRFPNLKFVDGDLIKNTSEENIKVLARDSNFLKSKIDQYEQQGYSGFQLMCDYSIPFGVTDESDKLVAFCRVTDLGSGNYYLGDTFVDEQVFGDKQKGTAYLYREIGNRYAAGSVLLIAPPERVIEFETQYGCKTPDNVMFKFGAARPELQSIFLEEKERIEIASQKTFTQGHGL